MMSLTKPWPSLKPGMDSFLLAALALSPALTLAAWDGTWQWYLFDGVTLVFTLTPTAAFFLTLLAIGAPLVALPMLRDDSAGTIGHILFGLLLIGMQLILLAGDFIGLFIGWEVMTWSSYLLLLRSPRTDMVGSQAYILFNLASAFFLLAGILVFYSVSGDFTIAAVADLATPTQLVLMTLFGLAFLIKVGNLPLHLWVPISYDQAPDSFSAILSGLMSKMGIYALFILLALFPDALTSVVGRWLNGPAAGYVLAWGGVITSIVATFKAIAQEDMKRLLAYSSIAQIGYITTAIGVGSALALGGALYHALVHTLIKLLLFTSIAGIIRQTGQRRFQDLGHLIYKMPISFFAVLIGIIGLAGMPPLPGFASKYLIFVALIDAQWLLLLAAMILSSTAAFVYCYKLIYAPFLGHATTPAAANATEAPWPYLLPQLILMGLLFGLGLFPGFAIEVMIDPVLVGLGMTPLDSPAWGILATPYGGYDGVVLMLVFGSGFALVTAVFFLLRGNLRRAGSPYDLSYAGEIPTAATPLHYGAGMGRELRRIPLVFAILSRSTYGFYQEVVRQTQIVAGYLSGLYGPNPQHWMVTAVLVLALGLTIQWLAFGG